MSKTYAQLQSEIAALQKQAEATHSKEKTEVVSRIKEAIAVYGLTAHDLGLVRGAKPAVATKKPSRVRKNKEAKYRDDAGNTWGGRGPRPKWLRDALGAGKVLQDFAA
jgi:DNA-binding protein H-NS